MITKTKNNKLHNLLTAIRDFDINVAIIFLFYSILRLFLPFEAYWIWGDEAKYLACAKSFPFHRMFNHSFYDYHPVFYPYVIRFFNIIFADHVAAIAVSFFSSLVLFFVAYRMFLFLNLKKRSIYIALIYMAFNNVLLFYSRIIFRYELFVCLFFLSFYMYLKGITTLKNKYLVLSALFGGLAFMTADMMPFVLLPALLGAFFVFGFKLRDKFTMQCKKILPIFLIIMIYISCVLLPRFIVYSTHTYYAGGLEGRIEKVSEFGLKQLISPVNFPNSMAIIKMITLKYDFNILRIRERIFSVIGLYKYDDTFYNWLILALIATPIIIMFLGLLSAIAVYFKNKQIAIVAFNKHRVSLYLFIITLGIFYPVVYIGFLSRYCIAAIPFLAYFLGKGVDILLPPQFINNQIKKKLFKYFGILILIILIAAIMKKSHHFIFNLGRIEACDQVGVVLDGLPKDGVLSEGLLADALVYNCKKRVVTLPRSPVPKAAIEQTEMSIKAFDLHYVLLSEFWKIESLAYPAVTYIQSNPDKFKLIKIVYEQYDKGISSNIWRREDIFYIYEVIRSKFDGRDSKE